MTVVSNVAFDPTFPLRIATTLLGVATLLGVVAAGIAVGVIVGRQTDTSSAFSQTKTVLRSNISIAINRLIASSELQEYYNASAILLDLATSINEQMKKSFPVTSIKVVISGFSGEPILISDYNQKEKKQLNDRPSIIIVNGNAYFTTNYTSNNLRTGFNNYSQTIVLTDINGKPSPALGTFSSKYSNFTNTYSTTLTVEQVDALVPINLTEIITTPITTIPIIVTTTPIIVNTTGSSVTVLVG